MFDVSWRIFYQETHHIKLCCRLRKYWYCFTKWLAWLTWRWVQFRMKALLDLTRQWLHPKPGNTRFDFRLSNWQVWYYLLIVCWCVLSEAVDIILNRISDAWSFSSDFNCHFRAGDRKLFASVIVSSFRGSQSIFTIICPFEVARQGFLFI